VTFIADKIPFYKKVSLCSSHKEGVMEGVVSALLMMGKSLVTTTTLHSTSSIENDPISNTHLFSGPNFNANISEICRDFKIYSFHDFQVEIIVP